MTENVVRDISVPQSADLAPEPGPKPGTNKIVGRSPWQLAWAKLRRDRFAMVSIGVIVFIALLALFAPVISSIVGHGPNEQFRQAGLTAAGLPKPPSKEFLFGTDDQGRDILIRVIYGARISLLVGVVATGLAILIGVVIGLLAGYLGGVTDTLLSRALDVVLSMPYLLFAIALVSLTGASLWITIGVVAFFSWASVARVVRGQVLSVREREFVEAARSLGSGSMRIMFVDILPNVLAPVIVLATLLIPTAIIFESSLSFLGLGVPPPTATWGGMLSASINYYQEAWWFIAFPGLALVVTTLAFNLLGDGVRDAFDPRSDRAAI